MEQFRWDANLDGIFTVSDIGLLLKWLTCWPGNFFMYVASEHFPKFAAFFEITPTSQYSVSAWLISIFVWFFVYIIAYSTIETSAGRY